MAELNGVAATFMAKWTMAEAGSSCHLHSSVWNADGSESLMWSDKGEHHMSDTYRWYMGGLMACALKGAAGDVAGAVSDAASEAGKTGPAKQAIERRVQEAMRGGTPLTEQERIEARKYGIQAPR